MKARYTTLAAVFMFAAVLGSIAGSVNSGAQPESVSASVQVLQVDSPPTTPLTFTQVYHAVSPSVVAIQVSAVSRNRVIGSGTGSGFVFDTAGHIVTNHHVITGADYIEVEFYDGALVWAEVVGADPDSDLAVLKVDLPADKLHPVVFADSDALEVGQTVLAIGSPFGQDWTLTSGIISALNRTLQGLTDFSVGGVIQTDAAINPGNSGGPLVDLEGRVIGVNSQILSTSNSSSGVGFAVPGNLTRRVIQELIENGYVDYSYIGILGGEVSLSLIDALALPEGTRGVVVSEVVRGGPAAAAGLKSAGNITPVNGQNVPVSLDIITAIDGAPLKGMDELISYLARATTPGQTVRLTVLRDGTQWLDFEVTLTSRP